MVGLSVVLEGQRGSMKLHQVIINKVNVNLNMIGRRPSLPSYSSSSLLSKKIYASCLPETGFLDRCFLCKRKLFPGKDIYMYKGDRAFCSEECRCRQIFMDEEESITVVKPKRDNCSLAAMKLPQPAHDSSSSPSSSTATTSSSSTRNQTPSRFVY